MTRLPRDLSGEALARALGRLGYKRTRQSGSHLRMTTTVGGEHHVTIPLHGALRFGTLGAIVSQVAHHFGTSPDDMIEDLFG